LEVNFRNGNKDPDKVLQIVLTTEYADILLFNPRSIDNVRAPKLEYLFTEEDCRPT
jgi:hypothetical protein